MAQGWPLRSQVQILPSPSMHVETIYRAKTIVKRGNVRLVDKSENQLHFKVKRRNGQWADVYKKVNERGDLVWDCTVVAESDDNKPVGCAYNGPKEQPYCSHSKACKYWLQGKDLQWGET